MNAKFEKLFNESVWHSDQAKAAFGDGYRAALQSLEVTTELVSVAIDASSDAWEKTCDTRKAMHAGLTAVFNAIKEQAK